ncbi:hypothetical protein FJ414_02400 [Mesorhizobium sp. B3-1-6]|uniref:hypothetical protein n=1 Tax=Mesorhizobium sp. B3-1-6 TaxID=2589895 RepID=UPI001129354F|nr:hypothetical protein [Mesorhizobium sp. B3-1-6]TPI43689.1 hypothetical protein FJ414_02400 [Mesorhizobium sp. B3-1-6]
MNQLLDEVYPGAEVFDLRGHGFSLSIVNRKQESNGVIHFRFKGSESYDELSDGLPKGLFVTQYDIPMIRCIFLGHYATQR